MPITLSARAPRRPALAPASASAALPAARRTLFSYGIAASYIGKGRPYDPSKHVFHFHPHSRLEQKSDDEKRADRPESGQDAFFVSRVGTSKTVAFGVADGVGGWMDSGVDPADFSHGLCEYMAEAASEHNREAADATDSTDSADSAEANPLSARQLMQLGYDAVHRDRTIVAGSSTAVVGLLKPSGSLEVANLGDSGFIQLRRNAVHAVSDPQTHAFNTPFQLSVIPPSLLARMAAYGGVQLSDKPCDAEVTQHDLQHGDVIVFASDGVWDNLFNQDILHLVSHAMTETGAWHYQADDAAGTQVGSAALLRRLTHPSAAGEMGPPPSLQSVIATHITAAARAASVDKKRNGPFSKEVQRYYPQERWQGGKVDDICVVVAVVSEDTAGEGETTTMAHIKSRL